MNEGIKSFSFDHYISIYSSFIVSSIILPLVIDTKIVKIARSHIIDSAQISLINEDIIRYDAILFEFAHVAVVFDS